MSSDRSDLSGSSSTWLLEIAVRACPSSQSCQSFKVATHPIEDPDDQSPLSWKSNEDCSDKKVSILRGVFIDMA